MCAHKFALRGHLAGFGVVTARGPAGVKAAIAELHGMQDSLPPLARMALHGLLDRLGTVGLEIRKVEREIVAWCRHDDASRRLMTIPGIGPITASAIAATVSNASLFRSGRQFAAWLGLTPRARSSGGQERLGHISKQGDGYIRRLLVTGLPPSSGWHAKATPARSGRRGCWSAAG
jgi:transposase